jgi:hypothetical protein
MSLPRLLCHKSKSSVDCFMHAAIIPNLDANTDAIRIFLVSNALAAGVVPTMIARYGGKPTYVTLYFLAAIGATVQFCGIKFIGFDNPMGAFGLLVAGWMPNCQTADCISKATDARPLPTLFVPAWHWHRRLFVAYPPTWQAPFPRGYQMLAQTMSALLRRSL